MKRRKKFNIGDKVLYRGPSPMTGDDHREYSIMDCQFNFLSGWRYRLSHLTEMQGYCIHGVPDANLILVSNQKPNDMSKPKTVCFGQALEALKIGGKVFREKWTGKILWAWLERGIENRFMAKFAGLTKAPYTMSEEDLLACDWVIMIDEEKRPYPDRIPVPENIKFKKWDVWSYEGNKGTLWGLCSPNKKLALFTKGNVPLIDSILNTYRVTAYLIPCKRSDLKPGDIAYRLYPGDDFKPEIIKRYCVILNDLEYAYWLEEMDMQVNSFDKLDWYKVIFE
jgi:hypothetical protein